MVSPLEVVRAWHAAVNAGDADQAMALSTPDIEVGGPRGSGRGRQLLMDWLGQAAIRLDPLRFVCEDQTVVVEQSAQWATEDGGFTEPRMVASVFQVQDGLVSRVLRYPDLSSALTAAEIGQIDPSP